MIALAEDTEAKVSACENAVGQSLTSQQSRPIRPLPEVMAAIESCAALPLEDAVTTPPEAYTSEEYYQWEVTNIFHREWQCVAHVSQIPKPGDFLNLDLLGEPLIVVRGKDESVRVLSRVCPHRGMDIMPPGFGHEGHGVAESRGSESNCGHTRLFLCPYHAWTFELDGKLKACPEMQQARGFKRDDHGLMPFRTEIWRGFIFVNFDGQAAPLAERLSEMNVDFGDWHSEDMQVIIEREWDCPFNWKVLVENFMESYHHLGAHAKTLQPMMPARDTWNEQERDSYVRCHLPFKEALVAEWEAMEKAGGNPFGFPTIQTLADWKKKESGLFLIYPNFLTFVLPDRVVWYRVQPMGPHRMKLLTTMLVPKSTTEHPEFPEMLTRETKMLIDFHLEDMEMCTAIQRGMRSLGAQQGRLSHLEMSVWLMQRYLAARGRGSWPGQDRPAAPAQR